MYIRGVQKKNPPFTTVHLFFFCTSKTVGERPLSRENKELLSVVDQFITLVFIFSRWMIETQPSSGGRMRYQCTLVLYMSLHLLIRWLTILLVLRPKVYELRKEIELFGTFKFKLIKDIMLDSLIIRNFRNY